MIEELKPCPEMIEKVARALAKADGKDPDAPAWVEGYGPRERTFGLCWRDQYQDKARAFVTAYDPDKRLREALEPLVRNAYEEGVDDGVSWHSYPESGPRPGWIDSVARIELFRLDAALSHNGG